MGLDMNPGEGLRVLIVDDLPDVRKVAAMSLRRLGRMVVTEAASSKEALYAVAHFPFDVVLLDVMMPDEDGTTTFQKIHETPGVTPPPIIFFTAKNSPRDVASLMALGARGVIAKPFDVKALPALLLSFLGKAP